MSHYKKDLYAVAKTIYREIEEFENLEDDGSLRRVRRYI
jgi:hypothetical protein